MKRFISTKLPAWKEVCLALAESGQSFELNNVERQEDVEFCSVICGLCDYSHHFATPSTVMFEPIQHSPGSQHEF